MNQVLCRHITVSAHRGDSGHDGLQGCEECPAQWGAQRAGIGQRGGPGHWEALAGQRGQAAVPACSSIRYVRSLFPGARDAFEPGTQGTPRPNLALKGFIIKITQRSQLLHVRVGVRLSCCIVSEFCVLAGIDKCLAL